MRRFCSRGFRRSFRPSLVVLMVLLMMLRGLGLNSKCDAKPRPYEIHVSICGYDSTNGTLYLNFELDAERAQPSLQPVALCEVFVVDENGNELGRSGSENNPVAIKSNPNSQTLSVRNFPVHVGNLPLAFEVNVVHLKTFFRTGDVFDNVQASRQLWDFSSENYMLYPHELSMSSCTAAKLLEPITLAPLLTAKTTFRLPGIADGDQLCALLLNLSEDGWVGLGLTLSRASEQEITVALVEGNFQSGELKVIDSAQIPGTLDPETTHTLSLTLERRGQSSNCQIAVVLDSSGPVNLGGNTKFEDTMYFGLWAGGACCEFSSLEICLYP